MCHNKNSNTLHLCYSLIVNFVTLSPIRQRSLARYGRDISCEHQCTIMMSLNLVRCGTRSQCKVYGVIFPSRADQTRSIHHALQSVKQVDRPVLCCHSPVKTASATVRLAWWLNGWCCRAVGKQKRSSNVFWDGVAYEHSRVNVDSEVSHEAGGQNEIASNS